MASLGKAAGFLLALGIVALVIWALVKGVEKDPAVVGTISTAVAGIVIVVYQRSREKRQELERSHRGQMTPFYKQIVETVKDFKVFADKPEGEQEAFFRDLSTTFILNGPTPVIKAWNVWQLAVAVDSGPLASLVAFEKVLLAIREDLGHDNSALKRGDLLRLFVNEDDDDESRAIWQAVRES